MKRKNPTKKHSKEFWNHHLDAWYSSRLSQSQYCRENDISSRAFSYHKILKYGPGKKPEIEPRLNLVALPMLLGESEDSLAPASESGISISFGNQAKISISPRYNSRCLAEVLKIVSQL